MEEKKIIFVCTGNTCRSPMAEAILRSELRRLNIPGASVCSAGIQAGKNNMNPNSVAVLSENGLVLENFSSRQLDETMLSEAYAVVCMTDAQRDILMDLRWNLLRKAGFSEIENNVYSFSDIAGYEIPDPFGKDIECYRLTYRKIEGGMSALIAKLFPETATGKKAPGPKKPRPSGAKKASSAAKPRKNSGKSRAGSGRTKKTSSGSRKKK